MAAPAPGESYFVIPCCCGAVVRSHAPETVCERCGRVLVVEWQRETLREG